MTIQSYIVVILLKYDSTLLCMLSYSFHNQWDSLGVKMVFDTNIGIKIRCNINTKRGWTCQRKIRGSKQNKISLALQSPCANLLCCLHHPDSGILLRVLLKLSVIFLPASQHLDTEGGVFINPHQHWPNSIQLMSLASWVNSHWFQQLGKFWSFLKMLPNAAHVSRKT